MVRAYDPEGVPCGEVPAFADGQWRVRHASGADPSTPRVKSGWSAIHESRLSSLLVGMEDPQRLSIEPSHEDATSEHELLLLPLPICTSPRYSIDTFSTANL